MTSQNEIMAWKKNEAGELVSQIYVFDDIRWCAHPMAEQTPWALWRGEGEDSVLVGTFATKEELNAVAMEDWMDQDE